MFPDTISRVFLTKHHREKDKAYKGYDHAHDRDAGFFAGVRLPARSGLGPDAGGY